MDKDKLLTWTIMKKLLFIAFLTGATCNNADFKTDKIIITSIPKCGTHLLAKCVSVLTVRPVGNVSLMGFNSTDIALGKFPEIPHHEILLDHIPYSPEASQAIKQQGFKGFFILRDPRDQVVSMTHWILSKPDYYKQFKNVPNNQAGFSFILTRLIKDVLKLYERFMPWLQDESFISIKYEELLGPLGGGSAELQQQTIMRIAEHLQMPVSRESLSTL